MSKGSWREFDDSSRSKPAKPIVIKENSERHVLVHKTRGGKRGKTVTVIRGLELDPLAAKALLKSLKSQCGVGGTVKEGLIELQGDKVNEVIGLLMKEGYKPKQSGG